MRFILSKILIIRNKVWQLLNKMTTKLIFLREDIEIKNYKINGTIFIRNEGSITIGDGFNANSGISFTPIGGDFKLKIITKKNAVLEIGNHVGISNSTIYCSNKISIGNYVFIGNSCKIWDTNFHSIDPMERCFNGDREVLNAPVIIKDQVFIGGGVTILKGVTIGENSIIGAGSVVTKSIPPNQIWGGNPAQFIRNL
ncbi:acyltransferase [Psychroserpens jangbogonensis]|uniref:acyltransferase n=1 Tax=Psychroserpens jangbogonensis TaxID=1484460 RepID=UPI00053E832A|nr:acyltransferase [Psychroserpens jangbogonensis]